MSSRYSEFRKLHESGCFVIPNPWDVGSAIYLQKLGFKAIASTSSGFAFTKGLPDEGLTRDLVLQHLKEVVDAVQIPVNADFQSGYADSADGVAESVRLCVQTGVAGLSIEDSTGRHDKPLYDLSEALHRLHAAREAIDKSGKDVLLTARAECFLVGHASPLEESIKRVKAYAEAGADVLFAPGPTKREEIRAIVEAAHGKPVNAIAHTNSGLKVSDFAELGVRRISVGSALARAAWTGFVKAAKLIEEQGSFAGFDGSISYGELNSQFC